MPKNIEAVRKNFKETWIGNEVYLPNKQEEQKAKTENLGLRLIDIPYAGLKAVGKIFAEGAAKYGVDNWKKGANDPAWIEESTNHAIRHLMLWANGDRSEAHLAKVAWFCLTAIALLGEEDND